MPGSQSELAPLSEAITNGVRVEVLARYSPENSRPAQNAWIFEYTVRITNQGTEMVQLLNRHWIITDAMEQVREVQGEGVIGKQPALAPGESFKYSSWCPLATPTGSMHGTYEMQNARGERFEVDVAAFGLRAPYTVH